MDSPPFGASFLYGRRHLVGVTAVLPPRRKLPRMAGHIARPDGVPGGWSYRCPLWREPLLAFGVAAALAAALAWVGPPGSDFAAHVYQRALLIHDGFTLWNNFWYEGRYSFVTYSVLYYPLAALIGIRLLAVAVVSIAALAFSVLVTREWGAQGRWSSRAFAVVWAGTILTAAFPFSLGCALALLAMATLQRRGLWLFAALAMLTLAASPLAFLLLALVLAGIGLARRTDRVVLAVAGLVVGTLGLVELALWRIFPEQGFYPFSAWELCGALAFCGVGAVLSWQARELHVLRFVFPVYAAACIVAFLVPSALGDNVLRLRFLAIPMAVLLLTVHHWRPRLATLVVLGLAASWNLSPLAFSLATVRGDPSADARFWAPAISFLHKHLTPSFRVEAVDTAGHWPAYFLPEAGIPLARGWYRQDDYPQNAILYEAFGPERYVAWLRALGVRYVVLAHAPADFSSEAESSLLRSDHAPLGIAFATRTLTIYEVPSPRPIVTGAGPAQVDSMTEDGLAVRLAKPGAYRVAVRYTPYWHTSLGCLAPGKDGMTRLVSPAAGLARITFQLDAGEMLGALANATPAPCPPARHATSLDFPTAAHTPVVRRSLDPFGVTLAGLTLLAIASTFALGAARLVRCASRVRFKRST
jgi:hypothetical protein